MPKAPATTAAIPTETTNAAVSVERVIRIGQTGQFFTREAVVEPEIGRLAIVNGFSGMPGHAAVTVFANWQHDEGREGACRAVADVPVIFPGDEIAPRWHCWLLIGAAPLTVRIPRRDEANAETIPLAGAPA